MSEKKWGEKRCMEKEKKKRKRENEDEEGGRRFAKRKGEKNGDKESTCIAARFFERDTKTSYSLSTLRSYEDTTPPRSPQRLPTPPSSFLSTPPLPRGSPPCPLPPRSPPPLSAASPLPAHPGGGPPSLGRRGSGTTARGDRAPRRARHGSRRRGANARTARHPRERARPWRQKDAGRRGGASGGLENERGNGGNCGHNKNSISGAMRIECATGRAPGARGRRCARRSGGRRAHRLAGREGSRRGRGEGVGRRRAARETSVRDLGRARGMFVRQRACARKSRRKIRCAHLHHSIAQCGRSGPPSMAMPSHMFGGRRCWACAGRDLRRSRGRPERAAPRARRSGGADGVRRSGIATRRRVQRARNEAAGAVDSSPTHEAGRSTRLVGSWVAELECRGKRVERAAKGEGGKHSKPRQTAEMDGDDGIALKCREIRGKRKRKGGRGKKVTTSGGALRGKGTQRVGLCRCVQVRVCACVCAAQLDPTPACTHREERRLGFGKKRTQKARATEIYPRSQKEKSAKGGFKQNNNKKKECREKGYTYACEQGNRKEKNTMQEKSTT